YARPEDARFAAGRGAERETPGREPAVRSDTPTAHAKYVSGGASVFVDDNRRHGGPGCGVDEGRAVVVQDVLRALECGVGVGGRHRREDSARKSREVFWGHPGGTAGGAPSSVDCQNDRDAPPGGAGPRAASAHLQSVEHSGIWQRGSRLSGPGERLSEFREIVALLQASGV